MHVSNLKLTRLSGRVVNKLLLRLLLCIKLICFHRVCAHYYKEFKDTRLPKLLGSSDNEL